MVQISYKEETLYYPQDEMHTCLLPVTSGCSWKRCAFCSMYKDIEYSGRDDILKLKNMGHTVDQAIEQAKN
jgi:radical SAM superfamily enzyme YgiQ (UPF0313 family)